MFDPWVRKIPWRGHGNPLQYSWVLNEFIWMNEFTEWIYILMNLYEDLQPSPQSSFRAIWPRAKASSCRWTLVPFCSARSISWIEEPVGLRSIGSQSWIQLKRLSMVQQRSMGITEKLHNLFPSLSLLSLMYALVLFL